MSPTMTPTRETETDPEPPAVAPEDSGTAEPGDEPQGRLARVLGALRRVRLLPSGRRTTVVALVLSALIALGAVGQLVVERLTALPADAVLRVESTTVTTAQFQQRVDLLSALYGVRPPADAAGHDRFQRDAAQAVAASVLIDEQAAQRHVVVPDTAVQNAVGQLVASFPQGQTGFQAALANLRISQQSVTDEIRRQLTASALEAQVTATTPPVTDADVNQAYATRPDLSTVPEQRHLRNIVLNDQPKAQQVADQARQGADFGALATQNSVDGATSGNAGDLGTLTKDQLEGPVGDAAFAAPAGGVYGPVTSQGHWDVGQVVEVKPAQHLPLDQIRDQVRTRLDADRHQQAWQAWIGDQFAHADVTYADAYQPANPGVLPAPAP
jgi:peptidyl-prolyl cis-trans isomerase C